MAAPASAEEYIAALEEPRRTDVRRLHELVRETLPHLEPSVASGMIGYGSYHYRYASGREGDTAVVGLASRKQYISLYVNCAHDGDRYVAEDYADRLPKADIGRACVRFKRTDDVDLAVLRELLAEAGRLGGAGAA